MRRNETKCDEKKKKKRERNKCRQIKRPERIEDAVERKSSGRECGGKQLYSKASEYWLCVRRLQDVLGQTSYMGVRCQDELAGWAGGNANRARRGTQSETAERAWFSEGAWLPGLGRARRQTRHGLWPA